MTSTRRPLGTGPRTSQPPAPPAEPRRRVHATQADLDTGPLDQAHLPDVDDLRARGVLSPIARPSAIGALAFTAVTLTTAAVAMNSSGGTGEEGSSVVHFGADDTGREWHSDVLDASIPGNNDPANFAPAGALP
ncbi:hypothetical protein [Streptomyces sp. NPDC059994]|uniref:hypothetical protein n=1 Tax=Streptomyces sp. NPDC059994 TaxID=3347029 RepID=UPI003686698A